MHIEQTEQIEPRALKNIQKFLNTVLKHAVCDSNILAIINRLEADNLLATPENIRAIYPRVKYQLADSADYIEAYRVFAGLHPEYKFDEATKSIFDAELVRVGDPITVENLEELLHPGNQRNVLDKQLSINPEWAQAQADQQERAAIIKSFTVGAKTQIDGRGRKMVGDERGYLTDYKNWCVRVNAMGLEELRQIRDARAEKKRLSGLSGAELKEIWRAGQTTLQQRYDARFPKLPQTYVPLRDGTPSRFAEPIKAGELIELTGPNGRENIMRLHRDDLHFLIRKFGADQLNSIIRGDQDAN
jgi:hypothetical protein